MPTQSRFKKKHVLRKTYFKEWREHRGLTQDQVADRIGTTKTRVSNKENRKEPYDQFYLEALAQALNTDPASLLMRNPNDDQAPWSLLESLNPQSHEKAIEYIKLPKDKDDRAA